MKVKKKLTKDQYVDLVHSEAPEGFEFVEGGDWVDEGKWSYKEVIFKFEDKIYAIYTARSGSYFSDYYYDYDDLTVFEAAEVEKVEVITHKWKEVIDG